jgi:hypothetical protein
MDYSGLMQFLILPTLSVANGKASVFGAGSVAKKALCINLIIQVQ